MRKFSLTILIVIFILSACQSNTLSLTEINDAPNKLAEHIDPEATLQLINDGDKGSYIVFITEGKVEANVEAEENVVTVNFDKSEEKASNAEQHIYYLTKENNHDTIKVFLNGEETYFNQATGM